MAKPMILKVNQKMQLPGNTTYSGGLGWSGGDLDLHLLRRRGGVYTPVSWFNKDWFKRDAEGKVVCNSQGKPIIVTPEEDLEHFGDDLTGITSATDYDEKFTLNTSKAPADVDEYIAFATIYDEKDEGLTLGAVEDIVCGVKDDSTGHEVQIAVAALFGFHVTARLARWTKDANGVWTMHNDTQGLGDADIFAVIQGDPYKVVIPDHWKN